MPNNRLLAQEEVSIYVTTLLDAACEDGGTSRALEALEQLQEIAAIYRGNADIRDTLSDPTYTPQMRHSLALAAFSEACELVRGVLACMAERGSMKLLPHVCYAYEQQVEARLGVCVVEVTTYCELDDELRELIKNKLEPDLGLKVVLRERIDKDLLGGIVIDVHGKRIDASVASMLKRAHSVLTEIHDGGESS